MNPSFIKEDLLYYLWQTKSFAGQSIKTTDGRLLEIMSFGYRNHESGPDFSGGKIKIDDLIWAGNIEMHVYSSEWNIHRHQNDNAYKNVILHVVWIHDQNIAVNQHSHYIPTLELAPYIDKRLIHQYNLLKKSKSFLPCASFWKPEYADVLQFSLSGYAVSRLEAKVAAFSRLLDANLNDHNAAFYLQMIKYFGGTTNKAPFERLSGLIPLHIFAKNTYDPIRTESLLFGVAGMLNAEEGDEYYMALKREYSFQKAKYSLSELYPHEWKYGKMLLAGFPTIRLAQLAALMNKYVDIADRLLAVESIEDIYPIFEIKPHAYWQTHYVFGKEVKTKNAVLTKEFTDRLIINAVVPFFFAWGSIRGIDALIDKATDLLDCLNAEKNAVVNLYKKLGMQPKTATETQGLLYLNDKLCNAKKCTECTVGVKIIKE